MRNYDKIKQMSLEELAECICRRDFEDDGRYCTDEIDCAECTKEWLKEEAKEQ